MFCFVFSRKRYELALILMVGIARLVTKTAKKRALFKTINPPENKVEKQK